MSMPTGVDKKDMQIAIVSNLSSALTMPQGDFIDFYCQPIEDDTWIRHEDIVKLENLIDTEGGEAIKQEILKDYIEERIRSGETIAPDPILEGMMIQEQYIREYQETDAAADAQKASDYRKTLVSRFRNKAQAPASPVTAAAPAAAADTDRAADGGGAEYPEEETDVAVEDDATREL